jgi:3,4-dihydroxy 2-butanone 4-phosphate synthase/GTP cyclohydrolase II
MASARIPINLTDFHLLLYQNEQDDKEHLALIKGSITEQQEVLTRIHSECFTGDVLGSGRCDCGPQLRAAVEMIQREGSGVIVYLRQEGRGIGLMDKLRAYNLIDEGLDTVDANLALGHEPDERDYTMAALILKDLKVQSVRLMTNNPIKVESLNALGVPVVMRVPLETEITKDNVEYLRTKAIKMKHYLNFNGKDHLQNGNYADETIS